MKPVENFQESPASKPQSGAMNRLKTTVLAAFAAIGVQVAVTENAKGSTILIATLPPASQTTTNSANGTQHTDALIESPIFHISFEQGKFGGTFTSDTKWQIDCTGFGGVSGSAVDLNYILQREFMVGGITQAPVALVDTTSIPAGIRGDTPAPATSTYGSFGTIHDSWVLDPVTNPDGIDIKIGYRGITDSTFTGSQANFAGYNPPASNANFEQSFPVNFTPNIPEPGAELLVGLGGALALLRRKRNNDSEKKHTPASE